MTQTPHNPARGPDGFIYYHKRVLYRLVRATGGADTDELNALYDELAPLLYKGAMSSPVGKDSRTEYLNELADEGRITRRSDTNPYIWLPVDSTDDQANEGRRPEAEA